MYTVRIVHHPAPGKGPELRAALEDHSKASNAAGSPHNVSQLLYGEEPTFVNAIRHESLADIEAYGARNANDQAYQARTSKIGASLARPQVGTLYESLVTTTRTGEVNYALRRVFYPAPGKAGELRKVVEERAKTPSTGSVGKAASVQILGPDRGHYVLTTLFTNLAGLEQYLKAQPTDAGVQTFVGQIAALTSGGHSQLYRILLRFPG